MISPNILLIALSLLLLAFPSADGQNKPGVQIGAASVNITPQQPVPMSGYAGREQPSKGVHDDIFAHAVVWDDGKNKASLIQADLIGFSFDFVDEITLEIEKKTGIQRKNILVTAVHNHGGPSTQAYGETATEILSAYIKELKQKLVAVTVEAYNKRAPALMGFGKGTCTMNINRRARHGEGGIWLGRNPDGPCDRDVDVTRIDNAHNQSLALLVNWPCHATVNGQENSLITGDWPGAAARYVDKNLSAGIPVVITAGASGDINPIYGPNNKFNDIEAIGLVLGEEIVRVASGVTMQRQMSIQVIQRELEVPGKERSASRMPGEKVVAGKPVKLRFSVLKIGAIVYVGISGELMTEIGMKIKTVSPFKNTVLLTHCNGNSGYLVTNKAYDEGGYEPMVSRTMPGTEKIIVDTVVEMMSSLE